jgi:hypothetical protein
VFVVFAMIAAAALTGAGGVVAVQTARVKVDQWTKARELRKFGEADFKAVSSPTSMVTARFDRDSAGRMVPTGYDQQMSKDTLARITKEPITVKNVTKMTTKKGESTMDHSEYEPWVLAKPEALKYEVELGWSLSAAGQVEPFARGSIHGSQAKGEGNLRFVLTNLHAFISWESTCTESLYIRSMYDENRTWFSIAPKWVGIPASKKIAKDMINTWKDLVAFELPQSFCAKYKLQKAPPSFDNVKFGRLTTFRWEEDAEGKSVLMAAEGPVYDDPDQFAELLSPHKISTVSGQSGSVIYKWAGSRLVPYGIHVSGTNNKECMPYNLCINSAGIHNHLIRYGLLPNPHDKIDVPKEDIDKTITKARKSIEFCLQESRKFHSQNSTIFKRSKRSDDEELAVRLAEKALKDESQGLTTQKEKESVLSDLQRATKFFRSQYKAADQFLSSHEKTEEPSGPCSTSQEFDIPSKRIPKISEQPEDAVDPKTSEAKSAQRRKWVNRYTGSEHSYPDGPMDKGDRIPKDTKSLDQEEWIRTDDDYEVDWQEEADHIQDLIYGDSMEGHAARHQGRRTRRAKFGEYGDEESKSPSGEDLTRTIRLLAKEIAQQEDFEDKMLQKYCEKIAESVEVPSTGLPTEKIEEASEFYPEEKSIVTCQKVSEARGIVQPVCFTVAKYVPDAYAIAMDIQTGYFLGSPGSSVVIHVVGLDGWCSVNFAQGLANRRPKVCSGEPAVTHHDLRDENGLSLLEASTKYKVGDVIISKADKFCTADVIHLVAKENSYDCPKFASMKLCADNLAKALAGKEYEFAYFPLLGGGADQDKVRDGRDLAEEWFSLVGPKLAEAKTIRKKYLVTPPAWKTRSKPRKPQNKKHQSAQADGFPQAPKAHKNFARNIDHTKSVLELEERSLKYLRSTVSDESEEARLHQAEMHLQAMLASGSLDLTSTGPLAFARNKVLISDLEKIPTTKHYLKQIRTILGPRVDGEPYCPDATGFPTLEVCYEEQRPTGYNIRRWPTLAPNAARYAMSDVSNDMISRRGGFKPYAQEPHKSEDIFCGLPMPPNSKEHINLSLEYQMGRRLQGSFEGYQKKMDEVLRSMVHAFDDVNPSQDLQYLDFTIRNIYDQLDTDKSQGWTETIRPGPKKVWDKPEDFSELTRMVKIRLFIRMVFGAKAIAFMSPDDAIHYGLKDPEKLFIKEEPHSIEKLNANKFRLIWAPSLVDTLLLGVLTRRFDKQNIACFQHGDSHEYAIGMGHHDLGLARTGEAIAHMMARAKREGYGALYGADYSGYDISVPRDAMIEVARLRKLKMDASKVSILHMSFLDELLDIEHLLLSTHVVQAGDRMLAIRVFGIVGSGTLVTGSNNTLANMLMTRTAGAEMMHVVSDDNIYFGSLNMEAIRRFGLVLKDTRQCKIQEQDTGLAVYDLPFTSHLYSVANISEDFDQDPEDPDFVVGKPLPMQYGRPNVQATYANPSKLLSNLLHKCKDSSGVIDPDVMVGVSHALRHTPYVLEMFVNYATKMNPENYRFLTEALKAGADFAQHSNTRPIADILGCPEGVADSAFDTSHQPEAEPVQVSDLVAPPNLLPEPASKLWLREWQRRAWEKHNFPEFVKKLTVHRAPSGALDMPYPRGDFTY